MLKVHLSAHPEVYGRASGEVTGDKVNKNLLFDSSLQHLYITTEKKVKLTQTWTDWLFFFSKSFLSLSIHQTPLCHHTKKVRDSAMCLLLLFNFIHRALMSRSFILSVLFDHLFIRLTHPNTSVYITTPKSAIDLFTHSLSLRSPLFSSAFFSSSVFLFLCPFIFRSPSFSAATPKWNGCYWFRNE